MSQEPKSFTDRQVIKFILVLCFICAFLLASVSFLLSAPQLAAKQFDQSKQMLISAGILSHQGYFLLNNEPAVWDETKKMLVSSKSQIKASDSAISGLAKVRIRPLLADKEGQIFTLEEKGVNLDNYLTSNKKTGFANLPLKLFYGILSNNEEAQALTAEAIKADIKKIETLVIPIFGFGLWAPMYGYIALKPDGNTVVGTTWYEMGETPGLGANITEAWWQRQFQGKLIFHPQPDGKTDYLTADMGIIVVKGKVQDVLGKAPLAVSAVDGLSGATLTGNAVTTAYEDSLTPYRSLLLKFHQKEDKS